MASAAPPTSPFPASDSDAPTTAIAIALDDVGVSVKHSLDVKLAGRVTRWGQNATAAFVLGLLVCKLLANCFGAVN